MAAQSVNNSFTATQLESIKRQILKGDGAAEYEQVSFVE